LPEQSLISISIQRAGCRSLVRIARQTARSGWPDPWFGWRAAIRSETTPAGDIRGAADEIRLFDWTQGELAEGLRRYDAGEFFAAHEAWESVWLRSREPGKTLSQELIQVTAAFHHLEHHNPLGTGVLLQASLRRLDVSNV
jgi:predicted transcriptional regulator